MKTKILVEIETKNMKEVRENEDGTGEVCTEETEKELHSSIKSQIEVFIDNGNLEEYVLDSGDECCVEGFESFKDYGDVSISIKELKE